MPGREGETRDQQQCFDVERVEHRRHGPGWRSTGRYLRPTDHGRPKANREALFRSGSRQGDAVSSRVRPQMSVTLGRGRAGQ